MKYVVKVCKSKEDARKMCKEMTNEGYDDVKMWRTEERWIVEAFGPPRRTRKRLYRSIGEFERNGIDDFHRGARSFIIADFIKFDVKIREKVIIFDMTYIPEEGTSLRNKFDFKLVVKRDGRTVFVNPSMSISVSTKLRPPDMWRTKHALYPIIYKLLRQHWQRTLALVLAQIPTAVLRFIDEVVTKTFPHLYTYPPYTDSDSTGTYTDRFDGSTVIVTGDFENRTEVSK